MAEDEEQTSLDIAVGIFLDGVAKRLYSLYDHCSVWAGCLATGLFFCATMKERAKMETWYEIDPTCLDAFCIDDINNILIETQLACLSHSAVITYIQVRRTSLRFIEDYYR